MDNKNTLTGDNVLLFRLNGVCRSYVIAGDVASFSRSNGSCFPPVSFSAMQHQLSLPHINNASFYSSYNILIYERYVKFR